MALNRYDWSFAETESRRMLEEIVAFEHAKLLQRPFKRVRWRPKKDLNYKYDPNKSDTVQVFADMTKWRQ